jgi:hypothetical protein
VLRELAEISVISMNCRGLKSLLFAPQNLIDKIKRNPNGKEVLLHYVQFANPPKIRPFTRFVAEDIATRKTPWPTQEDVDARLAPLQILDSWEKHKTEIKEGASPLNSPRGPGESPMTSPRKTQTALETRWGPHQRHRSRCTWRKPSSKTLMPRAGLGFKWQTANDAKGARRGDIREGSAPYQVKPPQPRKGLGRRKHKQRW